MSGPTVRMTNGDAPPDEHEIREWLGEKAHKYWQHMVQSIDQAYPGVFTPEWLFGGKKHGWSLRYKKSTSFCTLIPEKNRFALLIVFGAEERGKVEAVRDSVSRHTQDAYDEAATYHDGKWLLLTIDSERALEDAMRLLAVKRRPKGVSGG